MKSSSAKASEARAKAVTLRVEQAGANVASAVARLDGARTRGAEARAVHSGLATLALVSSIDRQLAAYSRRRHVEKLTEAFAA
jgi:hypothetical protein